MRLILSLSVSISISLPLLALLPALLAAPLPIVDSPASASALNTATDSANPLIMSGEHAAMPLLPVVSDVASDSGTRMGLLDAAMPIDQSDAHTHDVLSQLLAARASLARMNARAHAHSGSGSGSGSAHARALSRSRSRARSVLPRIVLNVAQDDVDADGNTKVAAAAQFQEQEQKQDQNESGPAMLSEAQPEASHVPVADAVEATKTALESALADGGSKYDDEASVPGAALIGSGSGSRSRKRMTNAERMARGHEAAPAFEAVDCRRSQMPITGNPTLVVRVVANTGADLGLLTPPTSPGNNGVDGLVSFDPSTRDPIKFQLPAGSPSPFGPGSGSGSGALGGGPGMGGSLGSVGPQGPRNGNGNGNGAPFEIRPKPAGAEDDGLFGLPKMLIGAIPHMVGDGELSPASPNFANMGMGQCDQGSPLDLNLPPLPLLNTVGNLLSGLPQLLGKVPGLLGLNLGGGQTGGEAPISGSGLPSLPLGEVLHGGEGLLHLVGPGAGSSSPAGGSGSGSGSGLPVVGGLLGGGGGGDEGLLGLHLPANLIGGPGPGSGPGSGSGAPTPPLGPNANTNSNPNGIPIDPSTIPTGPIPQRAQTAIWTCDERGNMGASWVNPDGSRVPAQFFTGGPCAHTICLAADVQALKAVHGGDLAEVRLVAGLL